MEIKIEKKEYPATLPLPHSLISSRLFILFSKIPFGSYSPLVQ